MPAIGAVVCHELAKTAQAVRLAAALHRDEHGRQPGGPDQPGVPLGRVRPAEPVASATARRTWPRRRAWRDARRGGGSGCSSSTARCRGGQPARRPQLRRLPRVLPRRLGDHERPARAADLHHHRRGQEALRQQRASATPWSSPATCSRPTPARASSSPATAGGTTTATSTRRNTRNHPVLIRELDARSATLIKTSTARRRAASPGKTLLDETLVVCDERVRPHAGPDQRDPPGPRALHPRPLRHVRRRRDQARRGHRQDRRARAARSSTPAGRQERPIYMEDIACTIYSALGIDWTKTRREHAVRPDVPLRRAGVGHEVHAASSRCRSCSRRRGRHGGGAEAPPATDPSTTARVAGLRLARAGFAELKFRATSPRERLRAPPRRYGSTQPAAS